MDIIAKNNEITKEILQNNIINIEDILDNIKGNITTEKIYKEIFSRLNIDLYMDNENNYYIDLKTYIKKISSDKCNEKQILNNKFAVDKSKIKNLENLNVKKYFGKYITKPKKTKLIEINGLQTINNSIQRYSKELNQQFYDWQKLCEAMIIHIPKYVESACKKFFEKELIKINQMNQNLQEQINLLKKENDKKNRRINKLEKQISLNSYEKDIRINKQQEQIDMLTKRFDKMKQLVE